jgi:hypothetical protein
LSVGKWREDELKGVQADLSVTDGDPELKVFAPHPAAPLLAAMPLPQGWSRRGTSILAR